MEFIEGFAVALTYKFDRKLLCCSPVVARTAIILYKNIKQSNSLIKRHIIFGNALYIIDAISVSKGQQSFYVGSLDLLFPSASNKQTSNYYQHNLRTVCECVIFLFKTKKRIRNSFVTPIMIRWKDRISEYGNAFHSTFSKQTRIRYQGLNRHQSIGGGSGIMNNE